jgi:hypothetical protein
MQMVIDGAPPVCELTPAMRVGFIASSDPAEGKRLAVLRNAGQERTAREPQFNAAVLDFFASCSLGQIGVKAW